MKSVGLVAAIRVSLCQKTCRNMYPQIVFHLDSYWPRLVGASAVRWNGPPAYAHIASEEASFVALCMRVSDKSGPMRITHRVIGPKCPLLIVASTTPAVGAVAILWLCTNMCFVNFQETVVASEIGGWGAVTASCKHSRTMTSSINSDARRTTCASVDVGV